MAQLYVTEAADELARHKALPQVGERPSRDAHPRLLFVPSWGSAITSWARIRLFER